jgi:signal transduction histidine kinase
MAGILAYQAVDASRSHQRIAQMAVKEHALFAVWELGSAIRRDIFSHLLAPGFEAVAKAGGAYSEVPLKDLKLFEKMAYEFGFWPAEKGLDYIFRYDLSSAEFDALGDFPPGEATTEWLRSRIEMRAPVLSDGKLKLPWTMFFHGTGENERVVALAFEASSAEGDLVAFGFQVHPQVLHEIFMKISQGAPLLPPSLTKGKPNTEVLSFVVHSPTGQELFRSEPQFSSNYSAGEGLGDTYGHMGVKVHLQEKMLESMVIGGLPRSRLPVIIGLLALSAGLVIAAIFQIRREQELAILRADFVSSVSHQLRTPLAQIRMFGETLLLGRVRSEEERRRSLEIIVRESQSLTHQVDNVLLFSRAQRNDVRLNPVDTPLEPLVREVLESFCPLAEAQECRVEANVEGGLSAMADPGSIRQILLNLLENAVKYGPSDQIVDVKVHAGSPGMVRLVVEDEGDGIPADQREAVFTPYARLDRDRDSGVAGSGIGLAVVLELATRQEGSAWAESSMSGGARLVVELPAGQRE